MKKIDKNYYYEHDMVVINSNLVGTHIAAHAVIKFKSEKEKSQIGVVLCTGQISYHDGTDSSNVLDLTLLDESMVCVECMKEYEDDNT